MFTRNVAMRLLDSSHSIISLDELETVVHFEYSNQCSAEDIFIIYDHVNHSCFYSTRRLDEFKMVVTFDIQTSLATGIFYDDLKKKKKKSCNGGCDVVRSATFA